jgi:SpoVK/Ycf46/Vps4 family AAA+-type ATPase
VAESQRRPLYTITCGDLGVDPISLEDNLRQVFEKAIRWNAVLLLDEADVFLQERNIRQLERNALVSVFLRELEYFDGILFLTTNRPGALDEAFQSRIHIILTMPTLDKKRQWKIWVMFLKDQMASEAEAKAAARDIVKETENDNLNGRQIRNNVRTALALASQEGTPLSVSHLKQVSALSRAFTTYMHKLNDMNADQKQHIMGIRINPS